MKITKYILVLLLMGSCALKKDGYVVLRRSRVIIKDNCRVPVNYPEIKGLSNTVLADKINQLLKRFPEHEYYSKDCVMNRKSDVRGDYKVLLQKDSILSIEFHTLIERRDTKSDTIFYSLVVNPNKKLNNDFMVTILEPEHVIPNFKRGMVRPYIEKYNQENDAYINLSAYEDDSKHIIMWGISKDDLIIYVGGEGELYGDDTVNIPLVELLP